jgi:sugar phosphate isomerase/epimerase
MLYTVREDCARDFEGTLRAVASLGYEGVEFFDLHGHDAAIVRGWLDEFRLVSCGRHAALDALETRLPTLAAECATLGSDRLVLSWIKPPSSTDAAKEMAGRLAGIARESAQFGLSFGFHNRRRGQTDRRRRQLLEELLAGDDLFLELDSAGLGRRASILLLPRPRPVPTRACEGLRERRGPRVPAGR